jgi:VWFA-related protein
VGLRTAPTGADKNDESITIRTEEVFLQVSVRDALGIPVEGLKADDFFIYDDGRRYEPLSLETRCEPVHVALLVDETQGMFSDTGAISRAVLSFRYALGPSDRIAVVRFSDEIELVQDWSADETGLKRALQIRPRRTDKAAIYDALLFASSKLGEVAGRRVIVLLTSGLNTAGGAEFRDALAAIQAVNAAAYVFSQTEAIASAIRDRGAKSGSTPPGSPAAETVAPLSTLAAAERELSALAEKSGGLIYFPTREKSFQWMLEQVASDLRAQYLITYAPHEEDGEGGWLTLPHRIEVLVRGGRRAVISVFPRRQHPK